MSQIISDSNKKENKRAMKKIKLIALFKYVNY